MSKKSNKIKLHHFFIPHPETHKKAHLISLKALLIYVLLFGVMQFSFKGLSQIQPNVLGISSNVSQKDLIMLTNVQREKNGLPPVQENSLLDKAAEEKAKNMFAENYWAHYSPSGKDPWGFILGAGYKYSYAGENLARNFYTSQDVVDAWMASKMGHKENILNTHYKEVGMAVMEGTLNGQNTILVVQEFGAPVEYIANNPFNKTESNTAAPESKQSLPSSDSKLTTLAEIPVNAVNKEQVKSVTTQQITTQPNSIGFSFDPYSLTKSIGFSLITFLAFLVLIDLLVIRMRKKTAVVNMYTRHAPNFALLPVATTLLMHIGPGSIL